MLQEMTRGLLLVAGICCAQVRPVKLEELPESLRIPGILDEAGRSSVRRLRDGEWDHAVFYALQSRRFTKLPPIEPAVSARQWHDQGRVPEDAARRMNAFVSATPIAERHVAIRRVVGSVEQLSHEYERSMAHLYKQEWIPRGKQGPARREFVGETYQSRGHSSDTGLWAAYVTDVGLNIIRGLRPDTRIRRVLLVGPGVDWAPRTAFEEDTPPQSYQPYALADSLIRLKLASPDLRIDCVDLNPRVVDFIGAFNSRRSPLLLPAMPGTGDWSRYFAALGKSAGVRAGRTLLVDHAVVRGIQAWEMNILTERVETTGYDLAVATNVLLYFNHRELGLAMANILHSLGPGGVLLHNDLRPAAEAWARGLGWPPVHARTLTFDAGLYDAVVLHAARK